MTHSDSGTDSDAGTYDGRQYDVETQFEATADNGTGEMKGQADGYWYGDSYWHDDPMEAQITITSTLKASVENVDQVEISHDPAYVVDEQRLEATLSNEFEWGDSAVNLSHNEGAVTFYAGDGNCFNWMSQDDKFKYEYETGDVEFYGTYVRADVGHCGDYF